MGKKYWEIYFDSLRKQDWKKAMQSLNSILKDEPDNSQVHLKIGDIFQKAGDTGNAIAAYHQAAWLLVKDGFLQKALAIYKIILRLDPENAEAINKSKDLLMELESSKLKTAPAPPSTEPFIEERAEQEATEVYEPPAEISFESGPAIENEPSPWLEDFPEAPSPDATEPDAAREINFPVETSFEAEAGKDIEAVASEKIDDLFKTPSFGDETEQKTEAETPAAKTDDFFDGISFDEAPSEGVSAPAMPEQTDFEGQTEIGLSEVFTSEEESVLSIPEFLSSMPQDEARELINGMKPQFFSPGQKIVEEGDSGDSIFLIKSGRANVVAHILGKEVELATLSEGDVFGEVAFLTGRPRTASVIAVDQLQVVEFNRFILEELFDKYPDIFKKVQDFYQSHVQDTLRKVKNRIKK